MNTKKRMISKLLIFFTIFSVQFVSAQDSRYTINQYVPGGTMKPQGYDNNYGNSSNSSKLYDSNGNFRGNVNNNQYDPDSISNPYGKYGNKYSPDSIKNPYGAGGQYNPDSPYNPYGQGLAIEEE